jgi:transcriptional regulator with XRE-family HTH domain
MARRTTRTSETLGQRIARLRQRRGYTRRELARELDLSHEALALIERDQVPVHAEEIAGLCRLLQVSADQLLGRAPLDAVDLVLGYRLARRLQRIRGLSRQDQEALLRVLDAFLGD